MAKLMETMAFALLVGAQFLAAIFLISKRSTLYPDQLFRRRGATHRDEREEWDEATSSHGRVPRKIKVQGRVAARPGACLTSPGRAPSHQNDDPAAPMDRAATRLACRFEGVGVLLVAENDGPATRTAHPTSPVVSRVPRTPAS